MVEAVLLLLASGQTVEPFADLPPPRDRLICRFETPIRSLLHRRKMCLTAAEWEKRDRETAEASRKMVYENMGDTSCLDDGTCTFP